MTRQTNYPSKKIKFALVTETFKPEINGVAMTLGNIVDHLIDHAHQVQVIRPKQSKHDLACNNEHFQEYLVAGMRIPLYPQLKLGFPAKNKLITLWKNNQPDIVHIATEGPLGWSALEAARALNIPTISSFHTNFHQYSTCYGFGGFTPLVQRYLRYFHNRTLATLVPTEKLSAELSAEDYANVSVMARGIDTQLFHHSKRCPNLRASWNAEQHDVVVLYVGRLAKEKNINLVIRAFEQIKSNTPNAKLVFVGDGPLQKELKSNCPEAIFAGNQQGEALAKHYASGDIFLFPSMTETYGNVVPEALASGLAVVAFNAAAAAQLITHRKNGMLIDFGNENAFVTAAQEMTNNKALRSQCRTNAHQKIQQLSWHAVGNSLEQNLYRLLDQHPPISAKKHKPRALHTRACT
jgi:glycosyltransferase involved in cell wall biosynthesis